MSVRPSLVALTLLSAVAAAGCGSSGSKAVSSSATQATTVPAAAPTTAGTMPAGTMPAGTMPAGTAAEGGSASVQTASVAGIGTVLVDGSGRTLYLFEPDQRSRPTCTGACASIWPALAGPATAGTGIEASLLATVSGANGRQVTYGGWPLYTFSGDSGPGQAHGQGEHTFGGYWYAVTPTGMAAMAGSAVAAPSTSAPTTAAPAGGGYGGGYGGY